MRSKYKTLSAVGLFTLFIAFAGFGCSQSPDAEGNQDGGPTDTMDGGPIDTDDGGPADTDGGPTDTDGGPSDTGDVDANYTCDAICNLCPSLGCECAPCTANGRVCPEPDTVPDGGFPSCVDAL